MKKYSFKMLKIGSWNIQGVFQKVNNVRVNKLEDSTFTEILEKHDVLCLQETHCGPKESPSSHITTHNAIPICRKISSNNRYFGGMLLLIRKEIREGVKILPNGNPEILGVKLEGTFFGRPEDTFVWFTYAPPLNSPYTRAVDDIFDTLEQKIDTHHNNLIMGDLNGHTGTAPDYIDDANDDHSPITHIEHYTYDTPLERKNMDRRAIDKQGLTILQKCKTWNMRILNGRTRGDRLGTPTRFPTVLPEKPSTIDYALCSSGMMNDILSFQVQPYDGTSDHTCISTALRSTYTMEEGGAELAGGGVRHTRIPFDLDRLDKYHRNLDSDPNMRHLESLVGASSGGGVTQEGVDMIAEKFNELIVSNAEKSFSTRKPRRGPGTVQNKNRGRQPHSAK